MARQGEHESVNFASLEARIRKAFEVRGAFPVRMDGLAVPVVNLFNADSPGFHVFEGRRLAGSDQVAAAVGGFGKVLLRAPFECVIERHTFTNLAGAPGTFTLRFLGPNTTDAFVYNGNNTFWTEGSGDVAETVGALDAVSNDALTPGAVLWRGNIGAQASAIIPIPVHLLTNARVFLLNETANQAVVYSWEGYAL